jgi:biotin carboxyl carrier protein
MPAGARRCVAESGRAQTFTALVGADTRRVVVVPLGEGRYEVTLDDQAPFVVDGQRTGTASYSLLMDGRATEVHVLARGDDYTVTSGGRVQRLKLLDERSLRARKGGAGEGDREIRAVMPGKVVAVLVDKGATVEAGTGIMVIEAMKMENEIKATRAGTITEIHVTPGQTVEAGELLAVVDD